MITALVEMRISASPACRQKLIGPPPLSPRLTERLLTIQAIAAAAAHATEGVDVNGDLFASEDYRRHLAVVYAKRAIALAIERAS